MGVIACATGGPRVLLGGSYMPIPTHFECYRIDKQPPRNDKIDVGITANGGPDLWYTYR